MMRTWKTTVAALLSAATSSAAIAAARLCALSVGTPSVTKRTLMTLLSSWTLMRVAAALKAAV